mmetsp:Transcript_102570/g.265243  ORF Transcript_102570/g.265243 Transcript_102570/m.265243 type:complete len:386 (-) Transcript_102570:52-1209(-)
MGVTLVPGAAAQPSLVALPAPVPPPLRGLTHAGVVASHKLLPTHAHGSFRDLFWARACRAGAAAAAFGATVRRAQHSSQQEVAECEPLVGKRSLRRRSFRPQDLLVPIVSANTGPRPSSTELRSPVAPSMRERPEGGGAAKSRRGFRNLPPPADVKMVARGGAGQPSLYSRIDAARDVRISSGRGKPAAADVPAHAIPCGVNLTPEPFCRAQRPDQRVTAVGVRSAGFKQSLLRSLESHGFLFERKEQEEEKDGFTNADMMDEEALRQQVLSFYGGGKGPVSGSGEKLRQLLSKHSMKRGDMKKWTLPELFRECGELQIAGREDFTSRTMIIEIKDMIEKGAYFEELSLSDLMYECAYRGLENHGTKDELLQRLSIHKQAKMSKT